jgi:hypothetical protein
MPPARRSNGTTTSKTGKRIRTEHRLAIAAVKSKIEPLESQLAQTLVIPG